MHGDVVRDTDPRRHGADVLYVGNFSIGEWHTRRELLGYLRHARARLAPGGVLVCDLYGGESSFLAGSIERELPRPDGGTVLYTWEQRSADPATGMVVNALHFELRRDDRAETTLRDAFVYRFMRRNVDALELEEPVITNLTLFSFTRSEQRDDTLVVLFDERGVVRSWGQRLGTRDIGTL